MQKTFSLRGHFANQTVTLGGFQFINGVHVANVADDKEADLLRRFLSQWQAEESNGKRDLQEAGPRPVSSGLQPSGAGAASGNDSTQGGGSTEPEAGDTAGGLASVGGGSPESVTDPRITRLIAAIRSLDPGRDEDWTQAGKPSLPAVERALGYSGIKRAEVEAVLPGFSRTNRT